MTEQPERTVRKTADGYVLTPPQVAALEAIEKRIEWPSMHWGVEDVSQDAWPHLARVAADAAVAQVPQHDDHARLAPELVSLLGELDSDSENDNYSKGEAADAIRQALKAACGCEKGAPVHARRCPERMTSAPGADTAAVTEEAVDVAASDFRPSPHLNGDQNDDARSQYRAACREIVTRLAEADLLAAGAAARTAPSTGVASGEPEARSLAREAFVTLVIKHPWFDASDGLNVQGWCPSCPGRTLGGGCNSPSHAEHLADVFLAAGYGPRAAPSLEEVAAAICGCGGTRVPYCSRCEDSSDDHYCPSSVPCEHARAMKSAAAVLALMAGSN